MNDRRAMESLVQGYLDGSLTADESRRLRVELRRQPAQVHAIVDGLRTDCLIRAVPEVCELYQGERHRQGTTDRPNFLDYGNDDYFLTMERNISPTRGRPSLRRGIGW